MSRRIPMLTIRYFERLYFTLGAVMLAAAGCLPWLVPLSYRVLGFEPEPARAGTYAAFQAHLATTALRRQYIAAVLALALIFVVLSLAGLLLRAQRRIELPWVLLVLATAGAAGVVVVAIAGLTTGTCC